MIDLTDKFHKQFNKEMDRQFKKRVDEYLDSPSGWEIVNKEAQRLLDDATCLVSADKEMTLHVFADEGDVCKVFKLKDLFLDAIVDMEIPLGESRDDLLVMKRFINELDASVSQALLDCPKFY